MDIGQQLSLFDMMTDKEKDVDVPIEGAVNLKARPISDFKVRLAYGDLTLLVAMCRDYVKGLDRLSKEELPVNAIEWEAYYRKKFLQIAENISNQIDYDYDKHLEKCLKKLDKVDNSDIGEEALTLTLRRGNGSR